MHPKQQAITYLIRDYFHKYPPIILTMLVIMAYHVCAILLVLAVHGALRH